MVWSRRSRSRPPLLRTESCRWYHQAVYFSGAASFVDQRHASTPPRATMTVRKSLSISRISGLEATRNPAAWRERFGTVEVRACAVTNASCSGTLLHRKSGFRERSTGTYGDAADAARVGVVAGVPDLQAETQGGMSMNLWINGPIPGDRYRWRGNCWWAVWLNRFSPSGTKKPLQRCVDDVRRVRKATGRNDSGVRANRFDQ